MPLLKGVYSAQKTDGSFYYRASFTYKNKHISLGSFKTENEAGTAYLEAIETASKKQYDIDYYTSRKFILPFEKYISIINFRDHNIYIKTPIYIHPKYFEYHLGPKMMLKFDVDDLFYYSNHKIMKRNNHLFVSDYGMQVSILSRYGIKNYAVLGKDYIFINGDHSDYRYSNIKIINKYNGVSRQFTNGRELFLTKIHINGDTIIGKYNTEIDAAIAYNKAIDTLKVHGITKNFAYNYIEEIDAIEYASRYNNIRISKKIRNYGQSF